MLRSKHVWFSGAALAAVAGLFLGTTQLTMAAKPKLDTESPHARPGANTSAGADAFNTIGYTTGFEAPFIVGPINGQPGDADASLNWSAAGQTIGGQVSSASPFTGTQHFRIEYDPTKATGTNHTSTTTGARISASAYANANPGHQGGIITVEWDWQITGPDSSTPGFASDYLVWMQDRINSPFRMWTLTYYALIGELLYSNAGFGISGSELNRFSPPVPFDGLPGYHHTKVTHDLCSRCSTNEYVTTYELDGVVLTPSMIGPVGAGTNSATAGFNQMLWLSNNRNGSTFDADNIDYYFVDCPSNTCGDGNVECGEECGEPGLGCNAGHVCSNCTCDRICTLDVPCELVNGANGPFTPPFDATYGAIFLYDAGLTQQAVGIDTCGTAGFDTLIQYWGSASDIADLGNSNDDCDESACCGAGSDPASACYAPGGIDAPYNSCTCHDLPLPGDTLWLAQINGAADSGLIININKETACGADVLGSCCDSNGDGLGCADDVLESACVGADKSWSNAKCAQVTCVCIPDCAGKVCGPDGCPGGSCGSCEDNVACTVDVCSPAGQCSNTPNSALCDNGLYCDGAETCSAAGCDLNPPAPCASDEFCDEDANVCIPVGACCVFSSTDISGKNCTDDTLLTVCTAAGGTLSRGQTCAAVACTNAIPTVSEWGLAIMSLLLLVGLKVYFGRREALA